MLHTLENDILRITAEDHGAELRSITGKSDGTEYLWNGDPAWWKYTAPVLFPIVGKLVDGKYRVDGKEYELPQHGFGRTSDYWCVREEKDEVAFMLDWEDETLNFYPFKFQLTVAYILRENRVEILWTVRNQDTKDMYFSIGAHPALRCPIAADEDFSDCYLKFNVKEKADRYLLDANGNLTHTTVPMLDGKELPLSYDLFKDDALIFNKLNSDEISICSRKSKKSITIRAKGFPWWGFWTPAKGGAPFLCIEPWAGHADFADITGELKDKDSICRVRAGSSFSAGYSIIIHEA